MKRLAIILAAVIVLVAATLIVAPLFVPADLARDRIAAQITQWIGRPVTFVGEPDITFFPRPSVRLANVVITEGNGSGEVFISADELTGTFRFLPLLWGAIEVNAFELVRPTIALRVDDDGRSNWAFDGTLGDRIAEAFSDPDAASGPGPAVSEVVLGRFEIVDGTITFDRPTAERVVVSDVSLDVHWPSTAAAATAAGSLVWRGEKIDLSATLAKPLELIAGRDSAARFTVTGRPIRIEFDGTVGRADLDFAFDGTTNMTTGSLQDVIEWAGMEMADGDTLAGAGFSGEANWAWPVLSFSDAEMRLDGNVGRGAVSIDFGADRTRIVGTLAFDELNLSIYADAFRADVQAEGAWRQAPIDLPVFDVDWDLRVSANRLIVAATRIEGFAASAIANAGRIDLRLAEAGFYGGHVQASVTGTLQESTLSAEAQLTLTSVDLMPALTDIAGMSTVGGRADATATLASQGRSWGELLQRLTGGIDVTISEGLIRGVDLVAAAGVETPTVAAAIDPPAVTTFTTLRASLSFYGGQVIADRLLGAGAGYDFAFTGWGSLTQPTIGGVGVVWLHGPGSGEFRSMPFNVTGRWLEPVFQDDPGAAAIIGPYPGGING
jgi:AsmA protein